MAFEDFTTYTEVDPGDIRIEVTNRRVTWTILRRNVEGYVYKDKGVANYDGNFVFLLTFRVTGGNAGGLARFWALANLVDDATGIRTANGDAIYAPIKRHDQTDQPRISIEEIDGGTVYTSGGGFDISDDTDYYIAIERDESVGSFGTFSMFTFSDSDRTTLINSQSITLHTSKKDYRYLYACQSHNSGGNQSMSAHTENLEETDVVPTVTAQSLTSVTGTTTTGNGTIVNLGISAVTAHGYVVDTTIDPQTTGDGGSPVVETDEGAGSTGVFSSAITGLLVGQEYYARPYATNGAGTGYGANIKFIAGQGGTQLKSGDLTIKGVNLQYTDNFGVERYIEGLPT